MIKLLVVFPSPDESAQKSDGSLCPSLLSAPNKTLLAVSIPHRTRVSSRSRLWHPAATYGCNVYDCVFIRNCEAMSPERRLFGTASSLSSICLIRKVSTRLT
ncbi:hypothetical protein B0H17DRAFT_1071365 [Mycena rosella]|uniref:Uncharacterized protein n=1 Tax=Mycena rosella TaxID=1033263 RepID=A0AAD7DBH7_MYCRO|nr:hypothetical protein B0H17DRAFT_1071365 [Mycena rosella]